MRIAKLHMDAQDKTRFEIHGKSSVKYHLKANHEVEAKRWFWALNNAIQWTKDEAKEAEKQKQRKEGILRLAKSGQLPQVQEPGPTDTTTLNGRNLVPASAIGVPLTSSSSRVSFQDSNFGGTTAGEEDASGIDSREPSIADNEISRSIRGAQTTAITGDMDDDEEYGDDASDHELQPASKDAFNITANSASLQLNLLAQVSAALRSESSKENAVSISDPTIVQALSTYESAVASLQGLVGDLLKISRDRDAYWQYRLDREADVRRLWEDSMAKVAREQEELEGRIGESEMKRKRTKRALREALESAPDAAAPGLSTSPEQQASETFGKKQLGKQGTVPARRKSIGVRDPTRRKSTIAELTNLSDSDSDEDEEFFDAVDAGEVEVVEEMPTTVTSPIVESEGQTPSADLRERKKLEIQPSFKGYEDPIRTRFKMEADNRPKISLWVGLFKHLHTGFANHL